MPVTRVMPITRVEEEKTEDEREKRRNMGQPLAKPDKLFQNNSVEDYSATTKPNQTPAMEVPGSLGLTLFNVIGLVMSGHHFYQKRRDNYNSNIYKVCIYKPRIVLSSYDGIRQLYESKLVSKEPSFGMFTFNDQVLGGHKPLIFENGQIHDKRRRIFLTLSRKLFCNNDFVENINKTIERELTDVVRMVSEDPSSDFEDLLAGAVNNVVATSLVGVRIDHGLIKRWMDNCLIKKFKKAQPEAITIYKELRSIMNASESFKTFVDEAIQENGVTGEDVCNEVMFSLV